MTSMSAGPRNVSAPGIAGSEESATRDEQQVVLELRVPGRVRDMPPRIDADEASRRVRGPDLPGQAVELEVQDVAQLEGRGDRQGPIPEVRLRSEELDPHPVFGELTKRQRRLERRDSASCDEHPLLPWRSIANLRVESTRRLRTSCRRPTAKAAIRDAAYYVEAPPAREFRGLGGRECAGEVERGEDPDGSALDGIDDDEVRDTRSRHQLCGDIERLGRCDR